MATSKIRAQSIATGAISSSVIADGSIDSDAIGSAAIGTVKLQDGAIHTDKIQDGAVHTDKIQDGAVHTAKLNDSAVHTDKIADGAVTAAKLDQTYVTPAQLDSDLTALIGGAPGALDTLNELAEALNDDSDFAGTVTTSLSAKLENVVEDTTPQLGGNLDLNSNDITGTGNINVTGSVTATSFSGDGSGLTGLATSLSDLGIDNHDQVTVDSSANVVLDGNLTFADQSGGYIHFGMDQRSSPVTGNNGAYIWSGSGSSGDYLAGSLAIQSRSNVNRNIEFITGSTPSKRMTVFGSGDVRVYNELDVDGNLNVYGFQSMPILQVVRIQSNTSYTTSSNSYVNMADAASFTPKRSGSLCLVHHGTQTWWGETTAGSGDFYIRFLVNGSAVWYNERARGNFDQSEERSHHYINSVFTFTTSNTSAHTIQLQGQASGNVRGGMNFQHVSGDDANQYIIIEYGQ